MSTDPQAAIAVEHAARKSGTGPYVICRAAVNERGFTEYLFGELPYVFHVEEGAVQAARTKCRSLECDMAIFKKVATVSFEVISTETAVVKYEKLAEVLTRRITARVGEGVLNLDNARRLVKGALLEATK